MNRNFLKLLLTLATVLGAFALAVSTGPAALDHDVFWKLRLPRALAVGSVGAGLSVSGVLIQASFGNPLADPFTVGIASAAALGAVVGAVLFSGTFLGFGPGAVAFVFAFLFSMGMAFWIRRGVRASTDILLVGVVSGFFFTAMATLILSIAEPTALMRSIGWLLGSATFVELRWSLIATAIIFCVSAASLLSWRSIDMLSVDELTAKSLGVDVRRLRFRLYAYVAVIVAVSVGLTGVIGFVGLIVPHALRRIGFRSSAALIPASFCAGAALVLLADVFARTVIAPSELPVGVVLSLVGAPAFLWLAKRGTA